MCTNVIFMKLKNKFNSVMSYSHIFLKLVSDHLNINYRNILQNDNPVVHVSGEPPM